MTDQLQKKLTDSATLRAIIRHDYNIHYLFFLLFHINLQLLILVLHGCSLDYNRIRLFQFRFVCLNLLSQRINPLLPFHRPLYDLFIRIHPQNTYHSGSSHSQPSIADFPEEVSACCPFSVIRLLSIIYLPNFSK